MVGDRALAACMVDGFGEFDRADYLRSWLMFDEVAYALAPAVRGPLDYPRGIAERVEFSVTRASLDASSAKRVGEAALADANDPGFLALVAKVPPEDAAIAGGAVLSDQEAYDVLRLTAPPAPRIALAYLLNKLLHLAEGTGAIPIVGQGHASDMIAWKARQAQMGRATALPGRPRPNSARRATYAAFAAGLSFGFIADEDLACTSMEALVRFKDDHRTLLHRSQAYIQDVARQFGALPDDDRFEANVEQLRQSARAERGKLDAEARKGLRDAGVKLAEKGIAFGGSIFAGGVALTLHPGPAAIAGVIAGAVAALPDAIGLFQKVRSARAPDLAYLFRLEKLSLEAATGLPRMAPGT